MSAASVHPQSAADCLIRSAVDISHPRQQGTPPSSSCAGTVVLSAATLSMALVQVQSGGVAILRCFLQASFPVLLNLLLSLCHRAVVTTCRRKVKHRITAPLRVPWLVIPSLDNEEADVRSNDAVADGHADIRASAVMTNDNDDDADNGNFDDTLGEILGASSMATPSLDLDLLFGAVDSKVDLHRTLLLSPLSPSPLPPQLVSPPPSATAGEAI